jgi:hypothetical protein
MYKYPSINSVGLSINLALLISTLIKYFRFNVRGQKRIEAPDPQVTPQQPSL